MFTVIVGENASGKTLYLDDFYRDNDCAYTKAYEQSLLRKYDLQLLSKANKEAEVIDGEIMFNDRLATPSEKTNEWRRFLYRECGTILLDEIDTFVPDIDKHLLYKEIMLVAMYKEVIAVTHDEELLAYADNFYTVRKGELVAIDTDEAVWEIYQDEKMVTI